MIETLQKEWNEHALGQDKQMEEIMMKMKGMIEELTQAERLIAEKRLKEEWVKANQKLAKVSEKLVWELAKATKRINEVEKQSSDDMAMLQEQLQTAQSTTDQLQSELQSSNGWLCRWDVLQVARSWCSDDGQARVDFTWGMSRV